MPSARAPSMSSAYESPTITASAGGDPERGEGGLEDRRVRLRAAVALRADGDVDVELVVARELLEVALPVRDQADPEPVRRGEPRAPAGRRRRGRSWRGSPSGGRSRPRTPRPVGVAAHAADDVLGERDPDLLVVLELRMRPQVVECREARRFVASGVEAEPVRVPDAPVRLRPELGPGPREREVDVEEDGPEHAPSIGRRRRPAPSGCPRAGASAPRIPACGKSGCPDSNWGPLRPERSALPGCATPRASTGYPLARPGARRRAGSRTHRLARGREGRDRRLRERAARGRALAGVRAARAPGLGADEVTLLACGVSSSRALFEQAADAGADMVLVHHGLFWRNEPLVVDRRQRGRLEALFRANASLLAYHLALDAHATLGNAAQLAARIGATPEGPFGGFGLACALDGLSIAELATRAPTPSTASRSSFPDGPTRIERLAVSTGAAGYDLIRAAHEGFDALLTGEPEEPNSQPRGSSASTCSQPATTRPSASASRPSPRTSRILRDRVALPRGREPGLASARAVTRRAKNVATGLRSSCARSILNASWCISGGGPVDPRQRQPSVESARLRTLRRRAFFMLRRRRRMANHLTPEELSHELGIDRDAIIKLCIEEGVPIYQGKIDKHLFQAQLEAGGLPVAQPA